MREKMIERLAAGETITGYKESGNSMVPIIRHRQPVTLKPIVDKDKLTKGDAVFCKVGRYYYTHLIHATKDDQVLIGNNHGRMNGWTSKNNVFGIVVEVDGTPRKNSQYK